MTPLACFRFAIYHFNGKITEVLKLLLRQDAKPTKGRLMPLTVRVTPEVDEGLQLLHSRNGAAQLSRAALTPPWFFPIKLNSASTTRFLGWSGVGIPSRLMRAKGNQSGNSTKEAKEKIMALDTYVVLANQYDSEADALAD